jgi:uncharacterized repeat protein (TIGR03803 family)
VSTDGSWFTNLYTFSAVTGQRSTNRDGAYPAAGLLLSGNTLYGTATYGGNSGAGTVFRINTDGTGFTNLHSFSATSGSLFSNLDGAYPQASVLLANQTLYGTAADGGAFGNGVVFALNTDGTGFTNLHSFAVAYYNVSGFYTNLEGADPLAALVLSSNRLFGTSVYGGRAGQGTVFALNTDGTGFFDMHDFTLVSRNLQGNNVNTDGANPASPLILSADLLYGTAQNGGSGGYGTVFALRSDGSSFTTLHHFDTSTDGANSVAGLVLSNQTLFGTATYGGSAGGGTIFLLNTNGTGFTNLYSFTALVSQTNHDGASPVAGLLMSANTLYGTAYHGAAAGSGSIFALSLGTTSSPRLDISASGPNVILAWPADALGFLLQSATNLGAAVFWTNDPSVPVLINGQNVVTNPIFATPTFFRLSR